MLLFEQRVKGNTEEISFYLLSGVGHIKEIHSLLVCRFLPESTAVICAVRSVEASGLLCLLILQV